MRLSTEFLVVFAFQRLFDTRSMVTDLLCTNGDYIINSISTQIRQVGVFFAYDSRYSLDRIRSTLVLQMLLMHGDHRVFEYIADVIQEVMISSLPSLISQIYYALDGFDEVLLPSFLAVLRALLNALCRWEPNLPAAPVARPEDAPSEEADDAGLREVTPEVAAHHRMAGEVSRCLQWVLTAKALKRCMHFASHENPRVRLLVLDIMRSGVDALANCTNELLPAAHLLWGPLVCCDASVRYLWCCWSISTALVHLHMTCR